jgi:hypothetical protein
MACDRVFVGSPIPRLPELRVLTQQVCARGDADGLGYHEPGRCPLIEDRSHCDVLAEIQRWRNWSWRGMTELSGAVHAAKSRYVMHQPIILQGGPHTLRPTALAVTVGQLFHCARLRINQSLIEACRNL